MKKPVLLILGDTPTKETGFGRVVRNNLREWITAGVFSEIHVWGIGYWGMPHDYPKCVKLYPAASPQHQRWEDVENLKRFAALAAGIGVTHIWLLQDVWGLAPLSQLMRGFSEKGVRSLLYFPVDAPLDRHWVEIVASVDVPVAYCNYGRAEMQSALMLPTGDEAVDALMIKTIPRIRILPHGVDSCFRVDAAAGDKMREVVTNGRIGPDDTLLLNVSSHQRRKGLTQTIQLWAELARRHSAGIFLYLHCMELNSAEGSSLRLLVEQMGMESEIGKRIFFGHESYFAQNRPQASDAEMNGIYNAADWLISTSLGEGWGLPLTEAMATKTPVAAPNHTSCVELLEGRGWTLPLLDQPDMVIGDNSRLRHRVDVMRAADKLESVVIGENPQMVYPKVDAAHEWTKTKEMSWAHIARQWLKLMEVI